MNDDKIIFMDRTENNCQIVNIKLVFIPTCPGLDASFML